VILRPSPLTLEVLAIVDDTDLRTPSVCVPSLKFVGLRVRKILCIYCVNGILYTWQHQIISNISFISDTFLCPISYVLLTYFVVSNG